jgi:hypothetical protein
MAEKINTLLERTSIIDRAVSENLMADNMGLLTTNKLISRICSVLILEYRNVNNGGMSVFSGV